MAAAPLDLFVAGAGPAYSDRPAAVGSAYVVSGPGRPILLDLGQGALPNVFRATPPEKLAAVLVSHLHPDHWVDLVPLRHYLRWELGGVDPLRVLAPVGLLERLDAITGEGDFAAGILDVEPLSAGPLELPGTGLAVEAAHVTHRGESYAFRVATADGERDAPALVYSGDCGRADDLVPLLRRGDTLLTEVSFGPGPVPEPDLHLDGADVGRLAARTGVGRVLLTHLQMGFDPGETIAAVRRSFGGPIDLAVPGDRFSIEAPDRARA